MLDNEGGALWRHEAGAYAVLGKGDTVTSKGRSGLSHTAAMKLADQMRREGHAATVVHLVGDRSYEVDSYPVR
jgi:hypothetical protein